MTMMMIDDCYSCRVLTRHHLPSSRLFLTVLCPLGLMAKWTSNWFIQVTFGIKNNVPVVSLICLVTLNNSALVVFSQDHYFTRIRPLSQGLTLSYPDTSLFTRGNTK
jgi:hypothetical protein